MNTTIERVLAVGLTCFLIAITSIGCDKSEEKKPGDGKTGEQTAASKPADSAGVAQPTASPAPGTSGQPGTTVSPTTPAVGPTTPEVTQAPIALGDAGKAAHENSALLAVAEIKSLLSAKDYDKAKAMLAPATSDYADTLVGGEFAGLLRLVDDGAAALIKARQDAAGQDQTAQADRRARFVAARDAGLAAMDKPDPAAAVTSFQAGAAGTGRR